MLLLGDLFSIVNLKKLQQVEVLLNLYNALLIIVKQSSLSTYEHLLKYLGCPIKQEPTT